jgi:cell division protein FtsI/penicillin-binding protein 2/cell division protein FtsW (lipid II flippase)
MPVTKSWTATAPALIAVEKPPVIGWGIVWLAAASLLVAAGLTMAYAGKSQSFAGAERLVNVNAVLSPEELAPLAGPAAEGMFEFLERRRPLANIGALAPLRRSLHLPLARLKPSMIVRTPAEFQIELLEAAALYFAGFYLVALVWGAARFRGDRALLAALHLLSGIGFILMVGMRDPLRDTLEFHKFALGVFLGCLLLALAGLRAFDYMRLADWCYTPLFVAITLFALLLRFGRGPGGNDAKVNLGPFQPVELIKILLVLFLAGYFTRNWERLRDLREKRLAPKLFGRIGLARLEHVAPVLVAVAIAVAFFFVLKDLGPALVTLFVFLAMFGTARGRPGLVLAGIVLMVASVAVGYRIGQPHTVAQRIDMWLAPWDNDVHGGDQLANALWAFSTGGPSGSGPGWGDTAMIPAGNTDLVLAGIGEEWGFAGVAAVFLLFAFLVGRAFRAAVRSQTQFGYFLALGLGSLIAFEMMLISSGVLGALPLSGVVSPFLSSGNTAMIANFLIFAVIASISADVEQASSVLRAPGRPPSLPHAIGNMHGVKISMACAALVLLGFAAHYQVLHDREYLARDAHAFEGDGVKRAQHNPRLNSIAREIPRGAIYDRNGIPLATSDWAELERHRAEYEALGVKIEDAASRFETRHYPFGGAGEHIVGDLRTGENFHASNASLVEHDSNARLQGYEYAELAGLVRYRHQPSNPALAAVLARDRNVHLTIDIRLQLRAKEILERHLSSLHQRYGAAVVIDAATGDVLAMVSAPAPDPPGVRTEPPGDDELLDRARYGLYPPGSTFKLVTAIAALNKDPELKHRKFLCRRLDDGRAGNWIAGWNRPIKDDIGDHAHGTLDMERAIAVSCNAYFAQLGVHDVGSQALAETAAQFGISTGELRELRRSLPFASYGQGAVLISPFKMARVTAAIANGGRMPEGRWQTDAANTRTDAPVEVLPASQAAFLQRAMRRVVTEGTGRAAMQGAAISFAGKTGTAQLDSGMPHSWFTGFAPYEGGGKRLAFAVLVEHGGYGALAAAPVAREVMEAAKELGLL